MPSLHLPNILHGKHKTPSSPLHQQESVDSSSSLGEDHTDGVTPTTATPSTTPASSQQSTASPNSILHKLTKYPLRSNTNSTTNSNGSGICGTGSPAFFSMFKALAKGMDEELPGDDSSGFLESSDEDVGGATNGKNKVKKNKPSGTGTGTNTEESSLDGRDTPLTFSHDEASLASSDDHEHDLNQPERKGTWIGPVEVHPPSNNNVNDNSSSAPLPTATTQQSIDLEQFQSLPRPPKDSHPQQPKIVIPPFFRRRTTDQDELSRRLASMSVSNYSDLIEEGGFGGGEGIHSGNIEEDGTLKPTPSVSSTGTVKSKAVQKLESVFEDPSKEQATPTTITALEAKQLEIQDSLKNDSASTVLEKLKMDVQGKIPSDYPIVDSPISTSPSTSFSSRPALSTTSSYNTDTRFRSFPLHFTPEHIASDPRLHARAMAQASEEPPITKDEKLAAIIEEFGDLAGRMERLDGVVDKEEFIAETHAAFFRGLIILGNCHLTTHRMTFHAMLPPPRSINSEQGFTTGHTDVIHSGPVTIHRKSGLSHSKARVWCELSGELLTTYPNSTEEGRVRPIKSVLLSSIKRVFPIALEAPCDIYFNLTTPQGIEVTHFTVDTKESALTWHREIETAIFEHNRARRYERRLAKRAKARAAAAGGEQVEVEDEDIEEEDNGWEMLRMCLPLDRVKEIGCEDFGGFARILSLDLNVEDPTGTGQHLAACAEMMDNLYPNNPIPVGYAKKWNPETNQLEDEPVTPSSEEPLGRRKSTLGFLGLKRQKTLSMSGRKGSKESGLRPSIEQPGRSTSGLTQVTSATSESALDDSAPGSPVSDAHEGAHGDPSNFVLAPALAPAISPLRTNSNNSSGTDLYKKMKKGESAKFAVGEGLKDSTEGDKKHINMKFALLAHRLEFSNDFHKAMRDFSETPRKYKEGMTGPLPTIGIGPCSAVQLPESGGGAGLDPTADGAASCLFTEGEPLSEVSSLVEPDDTSSDSADDSSAAAKKKRKMKASERVRTINKRRKAEKAQNLFGISASDDIWMKRCYLNKAIPLRGHVLLSKTFFCFWRETLKASNDVKYRYAVHELKSADETPAFRLRFHGLRVQITGHDDVVLEFVKLQARDETLKRIRELIAEHVSHHTGLTPIGSPALSVRSSSFSGSNVPVKWATSADPPRSESEDQTPIDLPQELQKPKDGKDRKRYIEVFGAYLGSNRDFEVPDEAMAHLPGIANRLPGAARKRIKARTFGLMTIGSRGDVQPYIALALELMKDGHKVVIITHDEFKKWIESYGIEHRQAGGDPQALMKLSVDHAMFSPGFFKESLGQFRQWFMDLLVDSWHACQGVNVIVESPSMFCGAHIAEALKIPYFRAFTMPWTRTTAYPQAFMVPAVEMGPAFNYSTYVLFDSIIWKATSGMINKWRKKLLSLPPTDLDKLSQTKIPMMYNFSSAVVPKPLDWHDDITITGYWNLANSDMDWTPPESLDAFIQKAKTDGKPLVYIGFGSIIVPHPNDLTRSIIKGVEKADVRAIIAKGWSSRGADPAKEGEDIVLPESCYGVEKIPHGWLFPKINAAMHHGGAGTTGASLGAGLPTLIHPWFGDQFLWSGRVHKLGVGRKVNAMNPEDVAAALTLATSDRIMIEKAQRVGQKISSEDGTGNAIRYMYQNLLRAAADRSQIQWQK